MRRPRVPSAVVDAERAVPGHARAVGRRRRHREPRGHETFEEQPPTKPVALTNAQRQRRYRERRAAGVPVEPAPRPPRPKSRPARWAAALAELRTLQAEYEAWRDQLPEALAESRTAERLDEVCDVDLDALDVELPRGFGRDRNTRRGSGRI